MPARAEIVRRKLLEIEETIAELQGWCPISVARLQDDRQLRWAVERGLQLAAEGLFDVGNHILAGEFLEAVDEHREIPRRLRARGVLSAETAARLEGLAGFRNVLVHDYAEVDLGRVVSALGRLDDFRAFVADVEAWLREAGRSPA